MDYMGYNETPTDWTAMKLNRRVVADISLTKPPKDESELDREVADTIGESTANIINGVVEDFLRPTAKIIVGSIVTVTVVTAICKIAVKTSPTK